jgi:exodeoxyribonuclease V beta subunit
MTIHKAKGLEASLVFLAGGLFGGGGDGERARVFHENGHRLAWVGSPPPDVKAIVDREEEEEEQRLMYVALTRAMGRLYLPFVLNAEGEPKPLRGSYDPVNRRVAALVRQKDAPITMVDMRPTDQAPPEAPALGISEWIPPASLLREDPQTTPYAALRERHAAALVTSYTRMRGEHAPSRSRWAQPAEGRRVEKSALEVDDYTTTTLRAARASGIFLHELLERVPLTSFVPRGSVAEWRARDDIGALFDEAIAAHRIDPTQRAHAEQLVWAAYTTPVTLPGGGRLRGFADARGVTREMEFVYPIPQRDHPAVDALEATGALSISHGYLWGSLDLAFEHEELTYFADWKSDSLASYAPAALAGHVAAHYVDQAKLYALAVVKLLGVRSRADHESRFGGVLYCFLRGFDESCGLWAARPGWDEIVEWDESLRARRQWRVKP